jgi:hypothetical protein
MAAVLSLSLSLSSVSRSVLASAPLSTAASTLMPLTSTACATSSSPWLEASLPLSAATSFSSALHLLERLADARVQLDRRRLERRPPAPPCLPALQVGQRVRAGDGLDAAHARGHAASPTILNRPMSPVRCTCVPPQSSRLLPMSSTRTVVAVLLAEQHHGAGLLRRLDVHHARLRGVRWRGSRRSPWPRSRRICASRHGRVVREVEARLVGVRPASPSAARARRAPRAAPCASGG